MRYILDKDGYIYDVSFGAEIECDLGTCTLYNGEVPNGYSTIEEWFETEIDKLNAWKIVEGNLVFDENRYEELQKQFEQEQLDNSCVIHKELYEMQDQLKEIKSINEEQLIKQSEKDKVIAVDNVKKIYSKVKLTDINCYNYSNIDVISTNKNMLPNEAITKEIDDLKININKDKSITLNGKCGTTETFTGTSIKINDGSNYKIDSLTIEGKSEQDGTPTPDYPSEIKNIDGIRNFLNPNGTTKTINGITLTNNGDGTFTANGTATANVGIGLTNITDFPIILEKGKTYTQTLEILSGSFNGSIVPAFKNTNNEIKYNYFASYTGNLKSTVTTKDTMTCALYNFYISKDATISNCRFRVKLEEGIGSQYWIPYGSNYLPIVNTGKNKFHGEILQGALDGSGAFVSSTMRLSTKEYINVSNKPITISYNPNLQLFIRTYDENKNYVGSVPSTWVNNPYTFTPSSQVSYIKIMFRKTNDDTIVPSELNNLMVEEEVVSTNYEPYRKQTTLIDLKGNELCSIGDVKDELSIKNGKTIITKRIGKVVLDGSEKWISHSYGTNSYSLQNVLTFNFDYTQIQLISNYFKGVSNSDRTIGDNITYTVSSREFVIRNTTFTSLSDFKTWLSTHNTTVYYELSEPYEIELDDYDIELFDGVNNISLDDDLDTNMETTCYTPKLIEYNIMGNSNNTEAFLCFKKNYNYYLSNSDLIIKMYNYDGTNREEVYSGTGGSIKFTDNDKLVTQSTLIIPTGTTFDNVTIYPQLEYGTSGSSYETPKYSKLSFDYSEYIEEGLFPSDNLYPSDTLYPQGTTIENIIIEDGKVTALINGEETELANGNVSLFDGYNNVYTLQDTTLEMTYCIDVLVTEERFSKIEKEQDSINIEVGKKVNNSDYTGANILLKINEDESEAQIKADKISLEGKTIDLTADNVNIASSKFNVDKEGNMTCKNATVKNVNIIGGNIQLTDDGTSSGLVLHSESDLSEIGIWSCGFYVEGKNYPEAEITEDMFAELGFRNGNMCLLIGGTDGYSSELTDYDLNFMSTDNNLTHIEASGIQTPKITGDNDILIVDSKIKSPSTYNNTSTGTVNMHVTANGYFARSTSSSKRYKKNIKDVSNKELDVNKLLEVPIRQYKYRDNYINKDDERYDKDIIGFIVEELEKYYPIAVDHNEDGTPEMWNSQIMIPAMLKLIQNQAKRIDELEKKVSDKNA